MVWARTDDRVTLQYMASVSPVALDASVDVRLPSGKVEHYHLPAITSFTANRIIQITTNGEVIRQGGEVVGATVQGDFSGLRRGQFYTSLFLQRAGTDQLLCKGYLYNINTIGLGEFIEAGSGIGNLFYDTVVHDEAGNVVTTFSPELTNARRILYGIVWYYHASGDTADRVLDVEIRRPWGALPTNGTAGVIDPILKWTGPSLSANQEGNMFFYNPGRGEGITTTNDNGTVAISSTNTTPRPFP